MERYISFFKILMIVLVLSTYSCSDFFSPDTETLLLEENSYKDYLSSRAAVNGLYSQLQPLMTAYVVAGELRGDQLTITANAGPDIVDIYELNVSPNNQYLVYRQAYGVIASCNDVFTQLGILQAKGTTYDEELDNMIGETVLLRSWVYFYLMRTYGETPYITESFQANGSDISYTEWIDQQAGEKLTAGHLITDITNVIPLLDPDKITGSGFFNLSSGYAMLGEIYLWEDQYDNAVTALQQSIATGGNSRFILDKDLENSKWQNIFKGDESATDEIMTKVNFDKAEKQENDLMPIFSSIAPDGNQLVPVSRVITALTGSNRFNGTFKNGNEVGKYTRSLEDPYTSDMPVILYRAADVHLMLSEAFNRLGATNVALDLLNNGSDSLFTAGSKGIRGRVALPPVTVTGDSDEEIMVNLENLILEVRGRELAFEGKRWFDILRIGKRRNDPAFIGNAVMRRFSAPDSTFIQDYFSDPNNWYLPTN
ncbi:MAG: RagB/SusD family nutrient uptake outer membrane protein [Saprospiraceae bacterium]|nr:RagB/SusD family nutrient uptake outer membrane protein [Saprospiraceae bacterium]